MSSTTDYQIPIKLTKIKRDLNLMPQFIRRRNTQGEERVNPCNDDIQTKDFDKCVVKATAVSKSTYDLAPSTVTDKLIRVVLQQ